MSEAVIESNNLLPAMQSGELSAVAREQSEVQSAIIIAKKFPRDEVKAYAKIVKSFERPAMAEKAAYQFPRGGQKVTGPSVDCAREIARCYGNIQYGLRTVSVDDDYIHIRGFAFDAESNTRVEHEDKFRKLIQRKDKQTGETIWREPDERDLRELVNRRGAILVRNAILQLVPSDFTDDALQMAAKTLKAAASGELTQSREDAIRRLCLQFDRLGVTQAMIEARLQHPVSEINAEELAELRQIGKSLFDGQAKRAEFFTVKDAETKSTKELNSKLKDAANAAN